MIMLEFLYIKQIEKDNMTTIIIISTIALIVTAVIIFLKKVNKKAVESSETIKKIRTGIKEPIVKDSEWEYLLREMSSIKTKEELDLFLKMHDMSIQHFLSHSSNFRTAFNGLKSSIEQKIN